MRIKEIIAEKGLTSKEIADRMGIAPPSFSDAINNNPTVKMLERIAAALDVHVSELFDYPEKDICFCPHCGGKMKILKM